VRVARSSIQPIFTGLLVSLALGLWLNGGCRERKSAAPGPSASVAAARIGPRIVFDSTSHDFGKVIAGAAVVHVFTVKNTGDQTLVLPAVHSTCGCTGAVLKTNQIPPGGSGEVKVTFSAGSSMGLARKSVVVTSNDPRAPSTHLEISAVVQADLSYEPRYIRLITDDPPYGTARVWLVGQLASLVKPGVPELRGDPVEIKQIGVRPIEERKGGALRRGIELKFKGHRASSGSALAVFSTGLADPTELAVPFSWGQSVKLRSPKHP
jgi:hypothetical protein